MREAIRKVIKKVILCSVLLGIPLLSAQTADSSAFTETEMGETPTLAMEINRSMALSAAYEEAEALVTEAHEARAKRMKELAALDAKGGVSGIQAGFDWNPVMDAIIEVESSGNPQAVCGPYVGVMQIAPVLVDDCNDILARRGSKKRYTLDDRYSVRKSKEMFLLIQSNYNPQNDVEFAIRSWSGGVHYGVKSTQGYYEKVTKLIKG